MLAHLSGKIHRIDESTVIIDVNGVGYDVHCAKNTLLGFGAEGGRIQCEIYTHVSESHLQLFGFRTVQEKTIFLKLISVSGVGPKLALTIISELPIPDLLASIVQEDVASLTRISGVGKKTAERLIVELKDKFKSIAPIQTSAAANDNPLAAGLYEDLNNALMSLGYQSFQIKKVVNGLDVEAKDTVQTLIKKSLARMQK